jgi:hypothetical protein
MGISQLCAAMAWQRKDRVEEVVSPFLPDSPAFELLPELAPRASEAIFDKLSMSAFEGTLLEFALRDGHRLRDRRRRDRGRDRAHGPPRRRPGPHSGRGYRRLRRRKPFRRPALARCARHGRRRDPDRHLHDHRPARPARDERRSAQWTRTSTSGVPSMTDAGGIRRWR